MQTQLAIFLVILGLCAGQSTPEPSPTPDYGFTCPGAGFYWYPGDCTKYYDCTNGLAWLFQCPANLWFDMKSQMCTYPALSDCKEGEGSTESNLRGQEIIGPAPNHTCVANGAWPHEEFCEFYYDCWEGSASLGRCTETYLFDLAYMGCNFPGQTYCGNRTRPVEAGPDPTTTTAAPTPSPPPGGFVCPQPSGFFPHPEDCHYFYQCVDGYHFLNKCPGELVFNPTTEKCDYISAVPSCQA